jgi:hypothetical protein
MFSWENVEDTKEPTRRRKSKNDRQWPKEKGQKGKQRSTKYYKENQNIKQHEPH